MNILVFSDSHSRGASLENIAETVRPDTIIHLGDHTRDAHRLRLYAPVVTVCGNCDSTRDAPEELLVEWEGVRIFLTHGHRYQVKLSPEKLWFRAQEKGAALAMCGHTHVPWQAEKSGVTLFNPGSIGEPRRGGPSYGVVRLANGGFSCEHVMI